MLLAMPAERCAQWWPPTASQPRPAPPGSPGTPAQPATALQPPPRPTACHGRLPAGALPAAGQPTGPSNRPRRPGAAPLQPMLPAPGAPAPSARLTAAAQGDLDPPVPDWAAHQPALCGRLPGRQSAGPLVELTGLPSY